MLTALEQGVKGEKWFRLNDKVFAERNLLAAFQQVAKKRGAAGDDRLMARLETKIADGPTLRLIESFLKADILEDAKQWTPEEGAPQGAVLSPLLSNVYLDPLDHLMVEQGIEMVRYADDFVILCKTAEDAARALEIVKQWVADNGLTLHPMKTRIVDARTDRFDFLGYTFSGENHWPRQKSLKNLRDAIRARTRRTTGDSLQYVVASVNPVLRGWFAYFQHSTYRNVFNDVDGYVRRRLRGLLDKRTKRRGAGRGRARQRWPNHFFAGQGLFSLAAAHATVVQSSRR